MNVIPDETAEDLLDLPTSPRYAFVEEYAGAPLKRAVTHEYTLLSDLKNGARACWQVINSEEVLFSLKNIGLRGRPLLCKSHLGARFLNALSADWADWELHFSDHSFNPYIELMRQARQRQPWLAENLGTGTSPHRLDQHVLLAELETIVKEIKQASKSA